MCEKCDSRARAGTQASAFADQLFGGSAVKLSAAEAAESEVWSSRIYGRMRYFDMGLAKQMIRDALAGSGKTMADIAEPVNVEELFACQVADAYVVAEHLDHVDMTEPIIMGQIDCTGPGESGQLEGFLMDGLHRTAKAHRDGIATLQAVFLSPEATALCEVPEDEYLFNEILLELLASGSEVKMVNGAIMVCGGRCPEPKPTDSPKRRAMLAAIAAGPAVLPMQPR